MSIVAEQFAYVTGVDTHARTHTYVVIETVTGRLVDHATFPTTGPGLGRAVVWIGRTAPGTVLAAVEGTNSYGAALHGLLRQAGVRVVEARPPRRRGRTRGKSDRIDAEAAARSVLGQPLELLPTPREGQTRSALRVLLTARRLMDSHRTADRNALTALLRTISLGIDARRALTDRQIRTVAMWRAHPTDDTEQSVAREEAIRLACGVITLTGQLNSNKAALRQRVISLAPGLLERPGIGPVSAAVFLTVWSHPGRVRSDAAFASLAGASPLPASSGNTTRHRLNRHGDRRLNAALDTVARSRTAYDPGTRTYVANRLSEGKNPREIRRLLKRYIARQVHRQLKNTLTMY